MRNTILRQGLYLLIFVCFLAPFTCLNAADGSFGNRIFEIQKNQADKGNSLAQYKLGTFYEFGVSVEKNTKIAKVWYMKAAKKKYKPAINRLTYLDIKQRGYDENAHAKWFKALTAEAERDKADSIIILGQMYHHGIIVKKDLDKALVLLDRASARGHAEIYSEIEDITAEIAPEKTIAQPEPVIEEAAPVLVTTKKAKKAIIKPVKKTVAKIKPAKKPPKHKTVPNDQTIKNDRAARERKYKEALLKIQQENMLLEQTQQWSEEDEKDEEDANVE